jgi:hypothetical protein
MLAGSIANEKLTNSSVTVGTTAISLGSTSTTLAGLTSVTSTSFVGALTGNASTATTLQTARTISLTGDVAGSVSFDGSGNAAISTTIQANSVALGTDTTGNYMVNVTAGTGVSVSHTQGEGSTATVSIGQAVGTTDNVTFNNVTVNGTLTSDDITSTNISVAGNATITGNLTVSGTTTTVNSTTVALADLNLELARNATTAAQANGAGITVTGPTTPATFTYTSADDRWNLNKNLNVTTVFGALSGNATTASTWQTARTLSFTGDATGSMSVNGSANVSAALTLANSGVTAGTYNNVTVNSKGLVTSGSNVAYLTSYSETDTLATVTGRGNSTTTNIGSTSSSVLNFATAGNIGTWIGAIQDGTSGWSLSGATIGFKSDNTTYAAIGIGTANGLLYFGRTTASGVGTMSSWLEVDSGGIANFKRARPQHNGSNLALVSELPTVNNGTLTLAVSGTGLSGSASFTANQSGNSTFTVTSNATNANTASTIVARDASGNFSAGTITAALSGNASTATTATTLATARTIALSGDVAGSVSFNGSSNVTISTTIQPNSVALGTDTTGNYMIDVTAGGGITISHTQGEGSTATISHTDTSSVGNLSSDNSGNVYIQDINFTFDTYGHVTGATVGTSTITDVNRLISSDDRTKAPADDAAARLTFGFTGWNNNGDTGGIYADYLHLRSYTDSSGGLDNLVMFRKTGGIGMRIWQQTWGSATAYSTYKDVAFTDNIGDGAFTVTAGSGLTGGGQLGTANQSGATSVTVSHADTSSVADQTAATNTFVSGITFDTYGHVQTVSRSSPSGFLTAEADTLATVTGRGASTSTASTFSGGLTVTGLTVAKSGTDSTITFPAQTNDPAYIKHYESNNTAVMYFNVSDDANDFFDFGYTGAPSTFRLRSDGVVTTGTWQGSSISTAYTDAKITSVAATSPIVTSASTGAITLSHANSGVTAGTYNNVTVNATGHVTSGSNVGYVTSVSGTGTVSGLSLGGTVTSSGNLTLSGTLSASIDNITDEHRVFNNMGDNHSTRTSFDASTPSYNFGWRYVQGSGNSPGVNSANQYYSLYVGLGNDYPATGAGSYGMQLAIPRNATTPYLAIRYNESNSLGSWQKISAGYADSAGSAGSVTNAVTFNNGGSGDASGTTYNGSAARTISYNTIGAAASGHNHTYDVNNDWLRDNGDNNQFKIYGNSRTIIYRTDGNTNEHGGGNYAHIFYYGGSADANRTFIINTDGRLWSPYHGWLDTMSVSYASSAGTANQIDSWDFVNTGSNSAVNADTINSNGISYYSSGVDNFTRNATDGALYSQRYSDSWQHQIAGDYREGNIAVRGKNSGTWSRWKPIPTLTISDTAPGNETVGDMWWESDTGKLKIRYWDGTSEQWVDAVPIPDTSTLFSKAGGAITGSVSINSSLTTTGRIYADAGIRVAQNSSSGLASGIDITNTDIRSNAASAWTGNPGAQGKIQYHSNRWYIVADSSSDRIVQFRRDGSDVSYIDNSGNYVGNVTGNVSGSAGSASSASTVTVNDSDAASTYRMVWHSGNTLYSTASIFCNPSSDVIYAKQFIDTDSTAYFVDPGSTTISATLAGPIKLGTITTSGIANFTFTDASTTSVLNSMVIHNYGGIAGCAAGIRFGTYADAGLGATYAKQFIGAVRSASGAGHGDIVFCNRNATDTSTVVLADEKLRITSAGAVTASVEIRSPIFYDSANTAFLFDGNSTGTSINVAGSIIAAGNVTAYSDIRLKTDVQPIENALDKVKQINGVTYTRKENNKRQTGVIAQDVLKVLPEAIEGSEEGMYSVAYGNMVGLLVEAIKEQQKQIEELRAEVKALRG